MRSKSFTFADSQGAANPDIIFISPIYFGNQELSTSPQDKIITITVQPRKFIKDITLPFLLRLRLHDPAHRPRGIDRLKKKFGQAVDDLLHGWMNLPARGIFTVSMADGTSRELAFDAHQSAYLAFISRALHGGYEPTEKMFLDAMLAKADIFYDVGANWGYYSLLAATHQKFTGKTFAFEVSDQMNLALENMAEALALDALEIVGCGLSDHSGDVAITAAQATHLTKVIPALQESGIDAVNAKVKSLDDAALPAPDLIKMDVEDHEIEVLRGGTRMLEQHKPLILFESRNGSNGGEAGTFLQERGYVLYCLNPSTGSKSAIDLVPLHQANQPDQQVNFVAVPTGQEARWFD